MLVLSSQARLLESNPVVWLCDQEPVRTFQKGPPPENANQRRWWTYLSQLRLTVHHIQGVKNECADYISRNNFDARIAARSEALAKGAFSRMDVHLDLIMTMIRPLDGLQQSEYLKEFGDMYTRLENRLEPLLVNQDQWKRDKSYLWHEDRIVVPSDRVPALLKWTHESSGHVGTDLLHNTHLHKTFTWIKGHADFDGNEHSDKISKWVSLNLHQHPEHHNPDTFHFIYHNHTPLPGRITRKTVKHLLPNHKHNNIHLPSSTDFYAHTSWFSRLPFKWTNGLYCCTGFLPHYKLNTYQCPKCHTHHPLDPITTVTECDTAKPVRDLFFEVWQQPFKQTVIDWWLHATKGERRNYIRTLIANSLSNALREIPPGTPYFQHLQNLKTAFKYRRRRLKTALQETQTWLRQIPINDLHLLQPDSADNPWNNQYSIYSTWSHNPTLLTYPKRTNTTVANKHPHKHRHVHSTNKKTNSQLLNLP